MAEMTPRERSELVRRQSRAYIAALRENRLQRATKRVSAPAPVRPSIKPPSAFFPSTQATVRAFEAKSKSAVAPVVSVVAPLAEAAAVRRNSAATLIEMRGARRPKAKASSAPSAETAESSRPASTVHGPKKAASRKPAAAEPPKAPPGDRPLSDGSAPAPALANPIAVETRAAPTSVPRVRAKRAASTEGSSPGESKAPPSQDIDAISGLGPALKSKLRQSGIATVDMLAAQKPDRLREVLGPAGRLVNLEALVRAATTACAGSAPNAPAGAKARTAPKSAPSQRSAR